VERAYALLNDWPVWRRNSAHAVALNACKAALAGEIDAETARTTLVALTGYGQQKDKKDAMAAGFDHHLVKPINFDALMALTSRKPSA
jgi:CheY-like chemotaxis protein